MMQLFEAQEKVRAVNIEPMLHLNAQLRSKVHGLSAEAERLTDERDEARAQRDAAIARITEVGVMVATNGNRLAKDAYRRGAEAMREACARWMSEREGIAQWVYDDALSALPIPEEP